MPNIHDMTHRSVADFLNAPVDKVKETAISAYAEYFNFNYEPNYLGLTTMARTRPMELVRAPV